jgi:hypothetical protein
MRIKGSVVRVGRIGEQQTLVKKTASNIDKLIV